MVAVLVAVLQLEGVIRAGTSLYMGGHVVVIPRKTQFRSEKGKLSKSPGAGKFAMSGTADTKTHADQACVTVQRTIETAVPAVPGLARNRGGRSLQ